jgi:hypothetical protein
MENKLHLIEEQMINLKKTTMPNLIFDGIVNVERYEKARIKILWILKEPHDKGNGGWDMRDFLKNPKELTKRTDKWVWKRTFKMMMEVTWGILKNNQSHDKTINDWKNLNDEAMLDIFNDIAYINIKKTPGQSGSYDPEIRDAYKLNKELIWKQINAFKPDVVICGGTYKYFQNDINQLCEIKSLTFINNNHPNLRGHKRDIDYYNEIINQMKLAEL